MPTPRQEQIARAAILLRVRVLGAFAVTVGDRPIPASAWTSRKAQQLVKLLALTPGHRLTRDQVLDLLWPDQDPETVSSTFRQTCYLARRTLAHPDGMILRGGSIQLAPPELCQVDSDRFAAAAATARRTRSRADYATALACYTGEVLPEDRYADWALVPAEHLRALATALRRELADLSEAAKERTAAETLWRQVLADEPADEIAHVGLMRLYAQHGQRQQAARQYHLLHRRLRDDLALAPDPATQRLYAAILSGQYPPPHTPEPAKTNPAPPPPHALPPTLTGMIGRTAEIAAVCGLLAGEARLLTLTGAGGCGKTRLARAVAEAVLPTYRDGVWWVALAPLADGALITETMAQVLGVRPQPGQTTVEALTTALKMRQLLLILDNAEHLRAACADLTLTLLRACPDVRVLITSRASLRIVGEQTWRVPSLPLPTPLPAATTPTQLATLTENDAVRLFVTRARLARPNFVLTGANAAAVVAICRRVEGLPLALELAAARIGLLAPAQLATRLDDALGLLTDGPQGLPDRQRTLRATLDWSYALLAPPEQQFLTELAVFAGGWHLEAAEAICADTGIDPLTGLAGLVEHSLVQVEIGDHQEEPRYRLLEPTRQYAQSKLAASGRQLAMGAAHARYFLALAETAEPYMSGPGQIRWLQLLRREMDNFRAGARWMATNEGGAAGLRAVAALGHFWRQQEYIREGWEALSSPLITDPHAISGDIEARVRVLLAMLAVILGETQAGIDHGQRGEQLYRALQDPHGQARALQYLGMNFRRSGETATAWQHLEEAAQLYQRVGDRRSYVACLLNLGTLAFDRGDVREALEQYTTALPEVRALGDARLLAMSLLNLTTGTLTLHSTTAVRAYLTECIELSLVLDDRTIILLALANFAALAVLDGDAERAARLLGAVHHLHQSSGLPILHSAKPFHDRVEAGARAALGERAYAAAYAAGTTLTIEEASAEAVGERQTTGTST